MEKQMEQRKTEIELKNTRLIMEELEEIIEGSFDGILVTDGDGNALLANTSYVRNTGIKKEDIIGHNIKEFLNPVWMKNSAVLLAIQQKGPVSLHHTTQHGRNIMATGRPIFDEKGQIKRVVVNTRDISEIYELQEELLKAKKMEKLYFEQMNAEDDGDGSGTGIVVTDPKMRDIYALLGKICSFDTTVLICGESGVGKEVVARYLHDKNTLRKDKPFITVNCGAIPENLLESELFGYEEGAFTGAAKGGKIGLFEAASGGTLFLDEIGEMSLNLQVKLLRALESRTIVRVGGTRTIPVDVRIVAATNRDLVNMVDNQQFREDLFYRLNVISVDLPPLKERKGEIGPMTLKFLRKFNKEYGQDKKITYEVIKEFESYSWPGNIRQLKNTVENMVVVSSNEYLQLDDIPWMGDAVNAKKNENGEVPLQQAMESYEKELLKKAKEKYGSSRKVGVALQVDQSTVIRKLKKYGL